MKLRQRIKAVQTYLRQRGEAMRFEGVRDQRKDRGQRWSAEALLSAAVFSLMVLTRSLRGAERFSQDLATRHGRRGIKRRVPDSTLGDFLAAVKPKDLREHLHRQILAEHRRKALEPKDLLEMLHAVHLRSEAARTTAWQQPRDWVRNALIWPEGGMPVLPGECVAVP